ncbi:TetR family transcriptional regulator [Enterococcus sp. 10A9_DIV0425]|uniref:TetR family transcriptional regulator n=1 Tax=Candidatus Enterococcus wittei TaxID=1987383 RepID=A0A242JY74_9ENTE|nr:TetR/AcrR family transcriptional regulator [Enterococcus sp. 10A9_DIV0425]OTP10274.1 TetR family transcriptional regulator [Enterococcus sp. 10A9_DIV0425]THE10893.1 TetR/AcrR family transcriptional regulator [Enterococcus hirae]
MPTQTFFHLPEEKQQRLLQAAKVEFSRVPLKDASIANIVKLSGISRGSFYQYFEDKEDLYFYYFEMVRQNSTRNMIQIMKEANGDLFAGFELYFTKMIRDILEGENALFYKHLFMNMDYRASRKVIPHTHDHSSPHKKHRKEINELISLIDRTTLKVNNDYEMELLIQLIMSTVFTTIAHSYKSFSHSGEYSVEKAIEEFKLKLAWLKNGAYK